MKIITVEPRGAACVFQSHVEGKLFALEGDLKTIMAGLNCGTPSGLGWPILKNSAFAFMSCIDEITIDGMNLYYYSQEGDDSVISGESGAVSLGALSHICQDEDLKEMKKLLEIDDNSKILLISTEGDTDPEGFLRAIGK